jgi:hypothetical protein
MTFPHWLMPLRLKRTDARRNYKAYDAAGQPRNGIYATMFEARKNTAMCWVVYSLRSEIRSRRNRT